MNTNIAKPKKVAIIGASGTYGKGILARAEEINVDAVVITRSPQVIGYNALRHSSFTLDYPRKRFVMHRRFLSAPDGQRILGYTVVGRMPYVTVELHGRPLLMNLDTGASEWMTIPPALTDSLVWQSSPRPGRITSNNQTGATRVLEGTAAGVFTLGPIRITEPLVYVNPDADDAWLGSSAMRGAAWTFDVVNRRVAITLGERP